MFRGPIQKTTTAQFFTRHYVRVQRCAENMQRIIRAIDQDQLSIRVNTAMVMT